MNKNYIIIVAILLFSICYSNAQDCSICAEAVKNGTCDQFIKETKHSLDESVNTMYTQDYETWENYDNKNSKTSSFDAAYQIYKASFSSITSGQERKETYNKQRSSYLYSRNLAQKDYEKISNSLINKTPFNSFNECIRDHCSEGLFTSYDISGNDIVLTIRWILKSGDPKQLSKLKSISFSTNVRPIDSYLIQDAILLPNNSITAVFKRDNNREEVIISLAFENLPPQKIVIEGEMQQSLMPIGMIIASTLSYHDFCIINDPESKLDYNNLDYSKILWVPADGRDTPGSKYARHGFIVPDLRGVFLRGINNMGVIGTSTARREQLNPESKNAGDFQGDEFKSHNHNKKIQWDISHNGNTCYLGGHPLGSKVQDLAVENTGGEETRPKNVTVYYYIRIN